MKRASPLCFLRSLLLEAQWCIDIPQLTSISSVHVVEIGLILVSTSTSLYSIRCLSYQFNPTGTDVNILAEIIAGLPNVPPQSLLRASPLGMLLMVCFTSFVCID